MNVGEAKQMVTKLRFILANINDFKIIRIIYNISI